MVSIVPQKPKTIDAHLVKNELNSAGFLCHSGSVGENG